jgi:hypothetical protein
MPRKLEVVKDPEQDIPVQVLERAIVEIANSFKKLTASRLNTRAIVLLIQDAVGVANITKYQVEAVIFAAADLEKHCLKPREKSD